MSNLIKLLAVSFLIIGCKTGYQVDKKNAADLPERSISNHTTTVTRDVTGAAQAVTRTYELHKAQQNNR